MYIYYVYILYVSVLSILHCLYIPLLGMRCFVLISFVGGMMATTSVSLTLLPVAVTDVCRMVCVVMS